MARKATLEEIERHWSLVDLANINEAMDIEEEMEEYYSKQLESNTKR